MDVCTYQYPVLYNYIVKNHNLLDLSNIFSIYNTRLSYFLWSILSHLVIFSMLLKGNNDIRESMEKRDMSLI